jgi:WD40 repeat protein
MPHLCRPADLRRLVLEQSWRARTGHVGSCLSVADILAALYGGVLAGEDPHDPDRDLFVLSKGHAALALYAALHLRGWLDAATLERQRRFAAQKERPWEMVGSADGRRLATGRGSKNDTIRVWEVPSAKPEGVTTEDRPPVAVTPKTRAARFALSADGTHLATVGTKGLTLWNAATGRELWASGKHRRGVSMVAFCPTRLLLATGDNAGNIFLWDGAGRVLARYDFGLGETYGLSFAPDGLRCAAVGGDQVILWDLDV